MKHPGIQRGKGHNFKDLTGQRFGRWTVLRPVRQAKWGVWYWLCRCCCGVKRAVNGEHLRLKKSRSCGCWQRECVGRRARVHGMSQTRFWHIWREMRTRCLNKNARRYRDYGGRGIRIEWSDFLAFKHDMYASYLRHVAKYGEKNTSIDRRDNDGPYSKKNCRWATRQQQNDNSRHNIWLTHKGVTRTLKEWSRVLSIPYTTLNARRTRLHWSVARTLNTPRRRPCSSSSSSTSATTP